MMRKIFGLAKSRRAAAAAEMAMILPLLITLIFAGLEVGNYFMNEHSLVKAVRNGARFAARQSFTNYPDCSNISTDTRDDTREVVMSGFLGGGTIITPNITADDIDVTTSCADSVESQTMTGIYFGRPSGAQVVSVQAQVDYRPIVGMLGFDSVGLKLNASSQAAVAGL